MSASENTVALSAPRKGDNFRLILISCLAALVGLVAGVVAYALYNLIGLCTNISFYHQYSWHFRSPRANHLGLWEIGIPVVGGLLIGLMAKFGSEKIRGHGIPEAMEAVLEARSRVPLKVAILKPISAAIGIGTGGPFGAEGPIIQTGGAFGSLVGQFVAMTATERKVLLACGGGAGLAATFNAPITGVLLALELLVFEFRTRSFIPLVIANVMAVAMRRILFGTDTMFHLGATDYNFVRWLPLYLVLGILCGFAAVGFASALQKLEHLFDRWKSVPGYLHPAAGALGLGIVGFFLPRVLGSGYDTIDDLLNNHLAIAVVLSILIFKSFVVLLSLGSGTSGGTLAPMFMISAALGNTFAVILNHVFPHLHLSPGAFAVAAMGALLGASARAVFAFMFCVFETTHDFHALLPVMLVCIVADLVAYQVLPQSIMTQRLAGRGLAVPAGYEATVLEMVKVGEVMGRDIVPIPQTMTVGELAERIGSGEPALNLTQGLPIASPEGKLVGVVTQGDLLRAMRAKDGSAMTVLEAGGKPPIVAFPDERTHDALMRMLEHNIGRLPVVSRDELDVMVGFVNRSSIFGAWTRRLEDEDLRESGWLDGFLRSGHRKGENRAV